MSAAATSVPAPRSRPAWLDSALGQGLALAVRVRDRDRRRVADHHPVRREPTHRLRRDAAVRVQGRHEHRDRPLDRDAPDLRRARRVGLLQGWAVQHRRGGPVPGGNGHRVVGGAHVRLHAGRGPPDRGPALRVRWRHGLCRDPRDPQGEVRRPRGRDHDHDERDRGQHRGVCAERAAEVHERTAGTERRPPHGHLRGRAHWSRTSATSSASAVLPTSPGSSPSRSPRA